MRTSETEQQAIIHVIQSTLNDSFELYLHGSCVDDEQKGGDIDLLLLTSLEQKNKLQKIKHIVLDDIKKQIGDQKIDLTIMDIQEKNSDPFIKIVLKKAVLLG